MSTAPTGQWDAKLLFATVAVVPVSPLRVTLDGPALAHILDGTITTWLHPDLRALNPDGIRDRDGVLVPDAPIVLLQGPLATSASLHATMTRYVPSYSGAAIRAAPKYTSEEALLTVLAGLAYSFSVALLRSFNAGIQIARCCWRPTPLPCQQHSTGLLVNREVLLSKFFADCPSRWGHLCLCPWHPPPSSGCQPSLLASGRLIATLIHAPPGDCWRLVRNAVCRFVWTHARTQTPQEEEREAA